MEEVTNVFVPANFPLLEVHSRVPRVCVSDLIRHQHIGSFS